MTLSAASNISVSNTVMGISKSPVVSFHRAHGYMDLSAVFSLAAVPLGAEVSVDVSLLLFKEKGPDFFLHTIDNNDREGQ